MTSIGFGASSAATPLDVLALISRVIGPIRAGSILATLENRADLAHAVAATLDLRVRLFRAAELQAIQGITTHSARVAAEVGTASVAEAAALAALGPGARLRIEKSIDPLCTCALAEMLL